ncbi:ankyrin repeat and MYND domain-containing protein 1-like isoform X2 [Clavelina lepadiformis]|uniref:ankyrin repeat and MYND domain-containing protein 1-like isoform X2 n=1 Tax=Clavelina lepadiformis TaxID=159417 RepID=UPI0040432978
MPSISPDQQEKDDKNLFLRLNTSTTRYTKSAKTFSTYEIFTKLKDVEDEPVLFGTFTWPSGATYEGEFSDGCRNGQGKQTWQDGSVYEGLFYNDMRHGNGVHKWVSGEVYEGQFYKDHRHGSGKYIWPNGTKYFGTFYLDRKEGYGKFIFSNGDEFQGLYKADERFGPGVMKYTNTKQGIDVGIWHREKLFKICESIENTFTMKDHEEYEYFPEQHLARIDLSSEADNQIHKMMGKDSDLFTFLSNDCKSLLFAENTALPPGIETYSKDFEHLPLTIKHKEDLDKVFYGTDYELIKGDTLSFLIATNNTPLMMDIQKHIYRYRHAASEVSFDVNPTTNCPDIKKKSQLGYLGNISKTFIEKATVGDIRMVYSILKSGLVDPNVSDCHGNTALIGAAMHCHDEVVNLLLDMGANVNQVNDEGVSALTACHIFYYPVDHFKSNIAEDSIHRFRNKDKTGKRKGRKQRRASVQLGSRRSFSPIRRSLSPGRRSSLPTSDLTKNRKGQYNDSNVLLLLREKLTSPINQKGDIETCKSDIRIMKAHRNMISTKSRAQSAEAKSHQQFEEELDDSATATTDTEARSSTAERPTFDSNENMMQYDFDVPDDLIERTATLLSLNQKAVSGVSTRDGKAIKLGTAGALAVWKAEHVRLQFMIELLLQRGANPDIGTVPFPLLFFAVKAGDVDAVKLLLERGASTEHRLSGQLGGLTVLHIASGIKCPEGVKIVELLLSANANPNTAALDEGFMLSDGDTSVSEYSEKSTQSSRRKETPTQWVTEGLNFVDESGRTPLHIACERDDNYKYARDIVHLLLDNGANPDVIWKGHSPLSLAVYSGNDLSIDELLRYNADASLPLTRNVGSVLCVAVNPKYEKRRTPEERIKLIDKLVAAGANILAPITFGVKKLSGTVVDYAHWMFYQDLRISHTPYHALNLKERETYTARKRLLAHLGSLLRDAAVNVERERLIQEGQLGIRSQSPSRNSRFLYVGAGAEVLRSTPRVETSTTVAGAEETSWGQEALISRVSFANSQNVEQGGDGIVSARNVKSSNPNVTPKKKKSSLRPVRKPLFRYCYDCGRSVGVRLTSCTRCHEVFYCSRACKMKAWEERHKNECLRMKAAFREQSPMPTPSEVAEIFAVHTLDETMERAQIKSNSIIDSILNQQMAIAEETIQTTVSRRNLFGPRSALSSRSARTRCLDSSAKNRRTASGRSEKASAAIRTGKGRRQNPAKVGTATRVRVGKDVVFGTTGMTLTELGITENYSFN